MLSVQDQRQLADFSLRYGKTANATIFGHPVLHLLYIIHNTNMVITLPLNSRICIHFLSKISPFIQGESHLTAEPRTLSTIRKHYLKNAWSSIYSVLKFLQK